MQLHLGVRRLLTRPTSLRRTLVLGLALPIPTNTGVCTMKNAASTLTAVIVLLGASATAAHAQSDPGARYVRLALALDVATDGGYVFAYLGPAEDREEAEAAGLSIDQIADETRTLIADIDGIEASGVEADRLAALRLQLTAMLARIDVLQGEPMRFDEEALRIFGVRPPRYSATEADSALQAMDRLLPGEGPLAVRAAEFQSRLSIPMERQEAVFRAAIAACRARTAEHIEVPRREALELVFVDDLPASGRYDYLGDYRGRVTVNRRSASMDNVIHLACHEAYPGHHLQAILIEDRHGAREWPELQVSALFGPASVISEGLGQHAVDLAMTDAEKLRLYRDELFPLAGLNPGDAERMVALLQAREALVPYATIEISRAYLDGDIGREEAIDMLSKYGLQPREQMAGMFGFVDAFRTYVVTYSLGHDLVRDRVNSAGEHPTVRWAAFRDLATALVTPELMRLEADR